MRILHLSNDFVGTKVHSNLYSRLDALGINQTIFTAVFSEKSVGINRFEGNHSDFIYAPIRDKWDSYFFRRKTKKRLSYINNHLDLSVFDLIHATTLFSDGAVALGLHKRYGIPFVVAIRDCDISGFLSKAPHTWNIGLEVLLRATFIIFISKALKERFIKHPIIKVIRNKIENKMIIQPNGIDEYWLQHISNQRIPFKPSFCYVGRMEKIKNVPLVIDSIISLKEKVPDIHFDIVGGGGKDEPKIIEMESRFPDIIKYYGPIGDKNILKSIYLNNNVFIMASHHETFGLVYIEALTQGLNIIYTKKEGIDGMFPDSIGVSVNSHSKEDICSSIMKIVTKPSAYLLPMMDFSVFDWSVITRNYISLYNKVLLT